MPSPRSQALLSTLGEFKLIQSIAHGFSSPASQAKLGIGDDAAILSSSAPDNFVISTDLLIEHIHFKRETASFYDIGYKAAVANLSDIAAMGALPQYILVAVALPARTVYQDWKDLYRGLSTPCRTYGVQLIGGDTSSSPSSVFVAITIMGKVKPDHGLIRSGAAEGDLLYVSGTLGDSAAGLAYLSRHKKIKNFSKLPQPEKFLVGRHLRPTPRIDIGHLLSRKNIASAAIDISDGLSGDLSHLCRQSNKGALIQATNIPMSSRMKSYASRMKVNPIQWALHGGEDYELLFSIPPQHQHRLNRLVKRLRIPITLIGTIKPRQFGIRIKHSDDTIRTLSPLSFAHFSR